MTICVRRSAEPASSLAQAEDLDNLISLENLISRGFAVNLVEKVSRNTGVVERRASGRIYERVHVPNRSHKHLSIVQERRSPRLARSNTIWNVDIHESGRNGIESSMNSVEYALDRGKGSRIQRLRIGIDRQVQI